MILKNIIHFADTNSVEATWVDENGIPVKCHSYADVQMDMLVQDLGDAAAEHAELIAQVEAARALRPAPTPPDPAVMQARIEAHIQAQIQSRLDAFARERGYDGMLSACTYATSKVAKFKAEGQACVNLRDATWAAAYAILEDVKALRRVMPTALADIESELPALVWPSLEKPL